MKLSPILQPYKYPKLFHNLYPPSRSVLTSHDLSVVDASEDGSRKTTKGYRRFLDFFQLFMRGWILRDLPVSYFASRRARRDAEKTKLAPYLEHNAPAVVLSLTEQNSNNSTRHEIAAVASGLPSPLASTKDMPSQ